MPRPRTFLGVGISASIRSAAAEVQRALKNAGAGVKWVEADSLHVTIVFLGDLDDTELVKTCRIATQAAVAEAPFNLRVGGIGAFPTLRRPKVIWGGITEGADALLRLHTTIAEPLDELGIYRREERAYTPHLTLGRANGEADAERLAPELLLHRNWNAGQVMIEEILLYQSELRRDGMEYTVMGRFPLAGS